VLALLRRSGFDLPQVIQTVFGDLGDIDAVQEFKRGCGDGGFVVVRACRTV
jgi:hypothetical protein